MYEISLVPDIKAELLAKQRLRNLILLICIGVAIAAGVIVAVLFSISTGQDFSISNLKTEIACRYDEKDEKGKEVTCKSNTGTPILKYNNMETLLTIQDQLNSIDTLNNSRIKFSRIFGLLDVLLIDEPNGQKIELSELNVDFSQMNLSFDGVGYDHSSTNIGYKPLETFKKNASKMYYDYGDYTRTEDNEDVTIPVYCITETTINGQLYGIYHKGAPGCEAPMVEDVEDEEEDEDEDSSEETDEDSTNEESTEETSENEVTDIYIRRSYEDTDDMNDVKAGKDKYWDESIMGKNSDYKGYSFNSACLQYSDDTKKLDETATIEQCPFLSDEIAIENSSYGRNTDDEMVLGFSAVVPVAEQIFMAVNHNMRIVGPSRQNVTDSYVQIRDMFTSGEIRKEDE